MDIEIEKLALEISEYFYRHPNAADSIEGITKWWLKGSIKEARKEFVFQALEHLCQKQIAKQSTGNSGKTIYSSTHLFNSDK